MKKLEEHTPGPWSYQKWSIDGAHDNCRVTVATTPDALGRQKQIGDIFTEANAALIAQAPTLLEQRAKLVEALRNALAVLPTLTQCCENDYLELAGAREQAERVLREVEKP